MKQRSRRHLALIATLLMLAAALLVACDAEEARPSPEEAHATATDSATPAASPSPAPTAGSEGVASTAAIPTDELPRVRFVTTDGRDATLPIEVPPPEEYRLGLSGRHELEGRGMLFYYPSGESTSGFWMQNTHIDLDIAFVDAGREVLEVLRMEANTERIHRPAEPYLAAIEAPAGWFESHGIAAGAQVEFLFELPDEVTAPR